VQEGKERGSCRRTKKSHEMLYRKRRMLYLKRNGGKPLNWKVKEKAYKRGKEKKYMLTKKRGGHRNLAQEGNPTVTGGGRSRGEKKVGKEPTNQAQRQNLR